MLTRTELYDIQAQEDIDFILEEFMEKTYQSNKSDKYYTGIYFITKNNQPIYCNYFIFDNIEDEYQADKKLWEFHVENFNKQKFSELNEKIEDIYGRDINIVIEEGKLFEDEERKELESLMGDYVNVYREKYLEQGIKTYQNTKDNYDMTDMINALNEIIAGDDYVLV
jgi:hypothetical protein